MEEQRQLNNAAVFYWSVCILRRLRDRGLLSQKEYETVCGISSDYYGTKIYGV